MSRLYIVEGESDLAAALTMGLTAIGRPSCQGNEEMISDFVLKHKFSEVVIIGDNDEPKSRPDGSVWFPGQEGAAKLQKAMPVPSCVWMPPVKDIREYLSYGASEADITASLKDAVWEKPKPSKR